MLALFGGTPVRTRPLASWPVFDDAERRALIHVLESGAWGGYSPEVKQFEERFAAAHECRFGVSAANGTVTLEAALVATGVAAGGEVIVPPITFIATATAVLRVGAAQAECERERLKLELGRNPMRKVDTTNVVLTCDKAFT